MKKDNIFPQRFEGVLKPKLTKVYIKGTNQYGMISSKSFRKIMDIN